METSKALPKEEIARREQQKYGCRCDVAAEIDQYGRPMHMAAKPDTVELYANARLGAKRQANTWDSEAAIRMLRNNLHPNVALNWEECIVYGGNGRAVRNWHEYHRIIQALTSLKPDETLCVQSGRAVYIAPTHPTAPRVVIANANLVPAWADQAHFDSYDRAGLTMYGQMTAGSWIYIGTQGILQGTYETFAACAQQEFQQDSLRGKFVLSAGMGAMSGAQPMAVTMNEGILLDVEVRRERIEQKVKEGYCDRITTNLDEALRWVEEAKKKQTPLSIGLVGNAAIIHPELVKRGIIPDIVTDQTPAHDLGSYIPLGTLPEVESLKQTNPDEYYKRAREAIALHVEALLEMQRQGAVVFDYGNNLRAQAELAGVRVRDAEGRFRYPGFVPAYIRPLFCEGKGPFRWVALSGDPQDIQRIDRTILEAFSGEEYTALRRWISKAQKQVPFIGLPARICWLGYGDRARLGEMINTLVASGELKAPVVIGRDHLDCGSVASPHRETEGMADGSDSIADWPLLNFALNAINGASWVSFHHGGGVGIGYALHAGMVIVADGTPERAKALERVLTVDPGIGVIRHAEAGYPQALQTAKEKQIRLP